MCADSQEQLNNFLKIADLQDELLALDFSDESELNSFSQELFESSLLDSKMTFRSVLISIYTCYLCRPHSGMNYIDLFIKIAKNPKNHMHSDDYILSLTNTFFIYHLYKSGLVTINSIYEQSRRQSIFFSFFYPEIAQNYQDSRLTNDSVLESIKKSVISGGYTYEDNDIESILDKFVELRSKGENPNPIALSIRNDNVEQLQTLLSQTNTPFNQKVKYSLFERFIFINEEKIDLAPTLIEYAAFFGSIETFKFLYQNVDTFPEKITEYAVAGGNYEIIHLCEQLKANFTNDILMTSIRFFQSDITSYLEENFGFQKTINEASKSIVYYNLRALIDCEATLREDPNQYNYKGLTVLSLASLNGDLDITNYLITTFHDSIDINKQTSDGDSPFSFACKYGHLDLVEYFSKLEEIDVNSCNNFGSTGLHYAASNDYIDIVKFLCQLPKIELNMTDRFGATPLMLAAKNGNTDIMKFLAEQPKILIYESESFRLSILECAAASGRKDILQLAWELVLDSIKDKFDKKEFVENNQVFKVHLKICLTIGERNKLNDVTDFLKKKMENF